jgi:hypothetical protein
MRAWPRSSVCDGLPEELTALRQFAQHVGRAVQDSNRSPGGGLIDQKFSTPRVEARLARHSGDQRTAEQLLLESLASADEAGATGWSLRTAFCLAELRRDAGREREAAAVLAPIFTRVIDGEGTRDFDQAGALLRQLPVEELSVGISRRAAESFYYRCNEQRRDRGANNNLSCGDLR